MKIRLLLSIIVLQALMFALALQPAMGITLDSGGATVDQLFTVEKTAGGTKVELTILLNYDQVGDGSQCVGNYKTDMYYFLRARIGNDNLTKAISEDSTGSNSKNDIFYPFAGVLEDVCLWDSGAQSQAIQNFIVTTVIPELFYGQQLSAENVKIKEVKNIVYDENDVAGDTCCDGIEFMMLDAVLAVQ